MKKYIAGGALAAMLVLNATLAISQSAPGTYANPIKGGATILDFSESSSNGVMSQGKVTYYQCGSMETQQVLGRTVQASLNTTTTCDEIPEFKGLSVSGQWNQWIRVTAGANGQKYQGLHFGTLSLLDSTTGALIATLTCRGSNGVGTHHSPIGEACENCAQPLHFEGAFSGQIVNGAYKGAYLQGTYAGDFSADPVTSDQSQPFKISMDGVILKLCPTRFTTGAALGCPASVQAFHLP